jgi:uncharacterized RDD family membrane protein YckC
VHRKALVWVVIAIAVLVVIPLLGMIGMMDWSLVWMIVLLALIVALIIRTTFPVAH